MFYCPNSDCRCVSGFDHDQPLIESYSPDGLIFKCPVCLISLLPCECCFRLFKLGECNRCLECGFMNIIDNNIRSELGIDCSFVESSRWSMVFLDL